MSTSAAAATFPTLSQFFSQGGMLAKKHPQYEFRRGQLQMAQAIEEAIAERRHLMVEAGTGTGKTLAYLMPAIRSGKRVIISTGTKNLQEQLFYKDIPLLEEALFGERGRLSVCYMKGRNNYLCRQKLYDLTSQPILNGLDEINQFRAIAEWEKITETGDRAEIAALPESSPLWHKLDARSDACTGQKCQNFDRCFITEMRRKAVESDIIIVNHHLFFADLSLKQLGKAAPDAGILPDHTIVVFDEAHELEEIAGNYFGVSVSNLRCNEVVRDIENTLKMKGAFSVEIASAAKSLRERAAFFFSLLPSGDGRFAFNSRREFLEENGDEYLGLVQAMGRLHGEIERMNPQPDEALNFLRRLLELQAQLQFVMESEDRNTVIWIERRGDRGRGRGGPENVFVQATPIDVAEILRTTLFQNLDTAVLTSATLAVSGSFDYVHHRLGLEHARELVVASHFDYEEQAILYVPPDMPDPRTPQFIGRATDRIRQVLEITRGRAFCLFTSYAQMHAIHDRLLGELEYPVLLQGSAPKSVLLEEFRNTPNAVLFGTSSFWQGVDVQGEQLSCVIIDRLPFAVPNDPVVAARIKNIDDNGGNAFYEYQVPAAVITLKQGFGRLIRSLHDRGVLMLLDNRVLKKSYGKVFLESLPPYHKTTEFADIERFFGVR